MAFLLTLARAGSPSYHPVSISDEDVMAGLIETQIQIEAMRQGVPPAIALAVAEQESGMQQYRPDGSVITGGAGEIGMFQLLPPTAAEVGVDPYDLEQNIQGGVAYLKQVYDWTGSWDEALKAYNGGIGNWRRGTTPEASDSYAYQVLARAGEYEGGGAAAGSTGASASFDPWQYVDATGQGGYQAQTPLFTATAYADAPVSTPLLLVLALLGGVAAVNL